MSTGRSKPDCLSVAVSGHRYNKLLPQAEPRVGGQLEAVFAAIDAGCAHFCRRVQRAYHIRLLSELAEGTDQLAAKIAPLDWSLSAVLPFSRMRYRRDFASDNSSDGVDRREAFDRLLARATTITELPGVNDGGAGASVAKLQEESEDGYVRLATFFLRHADIIVAVWDGRPSAGPGGTADVIAGAISGGVPVICIDSEPEKVPRLLLDSDDLSPNWPLKEASTSSVVEVVERILSSRDQSSRG